MRYMKSKNFLILSFYIIFKLGTSVGNAMRDEDEEITYNRFIRTQASIIKNDKNINDQVETPFPIYLVPIFLPADQFSPGISRIFKKDNEEIREQTNLVARAKGTFSEIYRWIINFVINNLFRMKKFKN